MSVADLYDLTDIPQRTLDDIHTALEKWTPKRLIPDEFVGATIDDRCVMGVLIPNEIAAKMVTGVGSGWAWLDENGYTGENWAGELVDLNNEDFENGQERYNVVLAAVKSELERRRTVAPSP